MKHAHNQRAASHQRSAPILWDFTGELTPLRPPTRRDRYGREHAGNPPDRDRDEWQAAEEDE